MKEKILNKKNIIILSSILIITILLLSGTYAFWTVSKHQNNQNNVASSCIELDFTENTDAITLEDAFPMIDEEGKNTKGFTFTLTNKCNNYVEYNINLESLNISDTAQDGYLSLKYLNAIIDNEPINTIGNYNIAPTLLGQKIAYDTRTLKSSYLAPVGQNGSTKQHILRIWMDEDTPESEMEKVYEGKISIYGLAIKPQNATTKIIALSKKSSEIIDDETDDHNYRYIGADPNNYILFNNELWRIIGVMNNVKVVTDSDNRTRKLKIIRDNPISTSEWDNKRSYKMRNHLKKEYYWNDWRESQLMAYLNPLEVVDLNGINYDVYFTFLKTSDKGDSYGNIITRGISELYNTINDKSKSIIERSVYYINSLNEETIYLSNTNANNIYNLERKDKFDDTWIGYVGLMYPSDYLFASSGSKIKSRDECLTNSYVDSECYNNNWLYKNNSNIGASWTISSIYSYDYNSPLRTNMNVVTAPNNTEENSMLSNVNVSQGYYNCNDDNDSCKKFIAQPVVYLKPDVKIISGDGSKNDPFIIFDE